MIKCLSRASSLAAISIVLGGCESLFLPDLNGGMLNPDIRFLRAGEVMNGVKCAMSEFMREREEQIVAERVDTVLRRRENDNTAKRFLLLYGSEYSKEYDDNQANILLGKNKTSSGDGRDNELNPYSLHLDSLRSRIQEIRDGDWDQRAGGVLAGLCWPLSDGKYRHWDEKKKKCVFNVPPQDASPDDIGSGEICPPQLGKTIWDYSPHSTKGVQDSHCTVVPDYSRFALDHTQQATIELSLLATNQGTVFYDFINQAGLGVFKEIITPGSRATGAVFPKADITAKGSTTFDMSAQMPQTIFHAAGADSPYASPAAQSAHPIRKVRTAALSKVPSRPLAFAPGPQEATAEVDSSGRISATPTPGIGDQLDVIKEAILKEPNRTYDLKFDADKMQLKAKDEKDQEAKQALRRAAGKEHVLKIENGKLVISPKTHVAAKKPPQKPLDLFTARERRLVETDLTPENQFMSGCGSNGILRVDDKTEIDYLKLKEMLLNVVKGQNDQVTYQGGPEVALDTLNLTSSFEIVLDMSAGTKHIFRLFPMVLPPQMGFKPDHTHTLKITLVGAKKKGDPQSGKNLIKACQQRLQPPKKTASLTPVSDTGGAAFCRTAPGQLLESMIEATESKSGGAGSSSGQ